ncbi:MAG: hypothetical protein ACE5K1_03265 [Acidiferrobacterales bacterium]
MAEPNYDHIVDLLSDWVAHEGVAVFIHYWDSGDNGIGAGNETIFQWRGLYWGMTSDLGLNGPYRSLREALEQNALLDVTDATESITCNEVSTDDLLERLVIVSAKPGQRVQINGGAFQVTDGKLRALA